MNKCKKLLCLLLTLATVLSICAVGFTASAAEVEVAEVSAATPTAADDFTWDNATVYFLLTDRFQNGNTSNDHSYGRGLNQNGSVVNGNSNAASFHGGDFAGITQKIEAGYFDDLGVNALWISAPYEQIHGYCIAGNGKSGSYPHYSYHGYYALDFTETDLNYGTEEEFQKLVDTAHEHGIRIVLDVVMNHVGYNTMQDMSEFGFGVLKNGWENAYYNATLTDVTYHEYIDYNSNPTAWGKWWGTSWLRAGLAGYTEGSGDLQMGVSYLPDVRTESTATVGIPEVLKTKWSKEGTLAEKQAELNTYFNNNGKQRTVRNYMVFWLTQWVEKYGIDGFRCDTAKHVELESWKALKEQSLVSLQNWRKNNPTKPGADWDEDFWMTGECFPHFVSYDSYYTSGGFDSMINFSFNNSNAFDANAQGMPSVGSINGTYADYAGQINKNDNFNVLTYLSSHDTALCRKDLIWQGSAFLLLPGAVQIYYGDETNRPLEGGLASGKDHALRSDMNWNSMDKNVLAHWQKVGTFRNNHVAVGAGSHTNLTATSGAAFARTYNKNNVKDTVVCVIGANKNASTTITLNGAFADGTKVTNAYTGDTATVAGGKVTFNSGAQGTILVEVDSAAVVEPTTTVPVTTEPTTAKPTEVPTTAPKTEPVVTTAPATEPSEEVTTTAPVIITKPTTVPKTEPTTTAPVISAEYVMLGDVDFSEKVNIKDATLIQKHLAKLEELDEKAAFAGNVDGNDVLNIRDVTNIQKWLAKMEVEYAIGEQVLYKGTEGTTPDATAAPNPGIIIPPNETTVPSTDATETPVVTTTAIEPTDSTDAPVITTAVPVEPTAPVDNPTDAPVYTDPIYTEPDNPVGGTITIYFENTNNWGSVYWHGWNEAGGTNTAWPGDPMENVGGNIYKAEVDASFTGIIFNDSNGTQTDNLTIPGDGQLYSNGSWSAYSGDNNGGDNNGGDNGGNDNPTPSGTITIYVNCNNGWSNVYWHGWNTAGGTNTAWPGDPMENIGNGVYKANVDASFTGIVFNDNNGNQTSDITIAGDGQIYDLSTGSWSSYSGGGSSSDNGGNGGGDVVSGDYIYFTDNAGWGTVYCHTWNMDGGTTVWPGNQMEYVDGQYRVMVDGTHTMVKFNNGNGVEGQEFELVLGQTYSN